MPQVATSPQTFAVSAAPASAPSIKQYATGYYSGSSLAFNAASGWATPTAGNLLLMQLAAFNTATVPMPAGWNVIYNTWIATGARTVYGYWKISDGTESAITISAGTNQRAGSLCEIVGANASAPVHKSASAGYPSAGYIAPAFPSLTPDVPRTLAIAALSANYPSLGTVAPPAGWDAEPAADAVSYVNLYAAAKQQDASLATVAGAFTLSQSTTFSYGASLILIKP